MSKKSEEQTPEHPSFDDNVRKFVRERRTGADAVTAYTRVFGGDPKDAATIKVAQGYSRRSDVQAFNKWLEDTPLEEQAIADLREQLAFGDAKARAKATQDILKWTDQLNKKRGTDVWLRRMIEVGVEIELPCENCGGSSKTVPFKDLISARFSS